MPNPSARRRSPPPPHPHSGPSGHEQHRVQAHPEVHSRRHATGGVAPGPGGCYSHPWFASWNEPHPLASGAPPRASVGRGDAPDRHRRRTPAPDTCHQCGPHPGQVVLATARHTVRDGGARRGRGRRPSSRTRCPGCGAPTQRWPSSDRSQDHHGPGRGVQLPRERQHPDHFGPLATPRSDRRRTSVPRSASCSRCSVRRWSRSARFSARSVSSSARCWRRRSASSARNYSTMDWLRRRCIRLPVARFRRGSVRSGPPARRRARPPPWRRSPCAGVQPAPRRAVVPRPACGAARRARSGYVRWHQLRRWRCAVRRRVGCSRLLPGRPRRPGRRTRQSLRGRTTAITTAEPSTTDL